MTFTANGKRQKWNFCRLSSAACRVKLFVFVMNSRRRYSIIVCFIYELEEKNSKSEVIFAVCERLTADDKRQRQLSILNSFLLIR